MSLSESAIWLFGSFARGDFDAQSDLDVLVVSDNSAADVSHLLEGLPKDPTVSRYTWNEVFQMSEYGSLFLHHLKKEGYPLFEGQLAEGRLAAVLASTGHYSRAERDVASFVRVVMDCKHAIQYGSDIQFELATLAMVTRHAAILGCYLLGKPEFGRIKAVQRFQQERQLSPEITVRFSRLYEAKITADRELPSAFDQPANKLLYEQWIEDCDTVTREVGDVYRQMH